MVDNVAIISWSTHLVHRMMAREIRMENQLLDQGRLWDMWSMAWKTPCLSLSTHPFSLEKWRSSKSFVSMQLHTSQLSYTQSEQQARNRAHFLVCPTITDQVSHRYTWISFSILQLAYLTTQVSICPEVCVICLHDQVVRFRQSDTWPSHGSKANKKQYPMLTNS